MGIVYFAMRGDEVIHHTDLNAMLEWDGLEPEKELTTEDFLSYGNIARVIEGEIFFGKTPKEKEDERITGEIADIDRELASIDQKTGPRPMRAAILALKGIAAVTAATDIGKVEESETRATLLRLNRAELVEGLEVPY
jgi:hypothetical protein